MKKEKKARTADLCAVGDGPGAHGEPAVEGVVVAVADEEGPVLRVVGALQRPVS